MTQQIAFQKARFCENINPGLPQSWIARSTIDWSGVGSIHLSEMKCFLSPGAARLDGLQPSLKNVKAKYYAKRPNSP